MSTPYLVLVVIGLALVWWAAKQLKLLPDYASNETDTGMGA